MKLELDPVKLCVLIGRVQSGFAYYAMEPMIRASLVRSGHSSFVISRAITEGRRAARLDIAKTKATGDKAKLEKVV